MNSQFIVLKKHPVFHKDCSFSIFCPFVFCASEDTKDERSDLFSQSSLTFRTGVFDKVPSNQHLSLPAYRNAILLKGLKEGTGRTCLSIPSTVQTCRGTGLHSIGARPCDAGSCVLPASNCVRTY